MSAPVLKWQYGGCLSGPFCDTGWHSSPAVADLDSDGQPDVIWGAYDVVALSGANGSLKWRAPSADRVWSGVAVTDLTGDGTLEVIVGRDSDQLTVYNRFGSVIWTRNPFGAGEIRTLAVADLENDGQLEVIVGQAAGVQARQVNVFAPDGTSRPGWPARHDGEPGFGGGMWNANVAVADMNGDGLKEVFGPNGSHYITALNRNGNQLPVNGIYAPRQFWSEVGVHVDHAVDLRGWANCGVEHRPDFSASAPVIGDVNGDGVPELIVVGNVRNCGTSPYTDLYHMPFIFKLDRTRWSGSGFDWTVIPTPGIGSSPRSVDFQVIENAQPNAVVADLDGDGFKEILFPSYDGKVHAYWLDKTEHGNWPYIIPTSGAPGDDFRFASEPIVVDLDNDGHSEVIFTSWPKKATSRVGQLHILGYQGAELHRINLPAPANGASWNGGLAAPTVANIDSDPDLELVVGTTGSGLVAYELPNTANARVLWGTGRGNYERTGVPVTTAVVPPDTTPPTVAITSPSSGATVSGTTTVSASASDNVGVAGVQFKLDGVNLGVEDTVAPYSISWSTTTASNGSHTLTAVARDGAGNTATSVAVTITVSNADTTPPTVAITSPANGATVSATISVAASASDNVGVAGVQFFLDDVALGTEDTTAPYAVTWDTTTASNGSRTLAAVARDAADNRASAAVTVTVFNGDTTAPTVSITSPAPGSTVSGTITVSAGASDNVGVAGVQFRLNGVNLGAEVTSAPYLISWNTTTATNGSHTLTAVARDAAGNTTTSAAVTVTVANDTTPPTVNITSPANGATVSGTIIVSASASDNVGVVGVQFRLDGADLGAEDTTAPYAVSWNTLTTTNGSHTLAAVARDATGNTATSATVTVTVSNAPPTSTATRFEETDLSIVYTPGSSMTQPPAWFQGGRSRAWSSATAAFNRSGGARATFRFTGTSGTWIGFRAFWAGIARVSVDGGPFTEVDLFLPACTDAERLEGCVDQQEQAPVFTATGLAAGSHTLTVEVTGLKHGPAGCDPAADPKNCAADYAVVVDAFDVGSSSPPPITGTRFEETAPSTTYTVGWTQGDTTRTWSGGTAGASGIPGARATFTFTGTSVRWIGLRGPGTGIARVYLDGAFHAEVDTYSPTEIQAVVLTVTDLAAARHTLAIEATGRKNSRATDSVVVVDAFDVRSRFEDQDPSITYTLIDPAASWILENRDRAWSGTTANSGGGAAAFSRAGTRAEFTFTGTEVTWIGFRGPFAGMADVSLDGAFVGRVDLYSSSEELRAPVFTATGLTAGPHAVRIDVPGVRNTASADSLIVVDAFDVTPPAPGVPVARFQETDPPVSYTPASAWTQSSLNGFYTGGAVFSSATAGARADFTFTGTSVRWIGQRGRELGIARLSLDGTLVGEVDTFVPADSQERFQAPVFTATGLPAGPHTLTIEVTGLKNPFSGGSLILVDAFDVY